MALSKFSAEESGEGLMAEINITPLTDIFLVLLIIFMITQSAIVESAAKVNLPKATQTAQESRGVTVSVTADNRIFVNQLPVEIAQLQATLQDLLADDPRKLVILQGDRSVMLGEAVHVMDIAKRAGAQAISIAAEKESAP
jgi:biopolymer transport protein ExbD